MDQSRKAAIEKAAEDPSKESLAIKLIQFLLLEGAISQRYYQMTKFILLKRLQ
jgi:hypothetical protein